MNQSDYDVAIIGAGATGVGLFHRLAERGISSVLIDKGEVSDQTSSKSSKMLHGGIRYLENLDLSLVFEALKERNFWEKRAPEFCQRKTFYLPIYKDSPVAPWKMKIGIKLYASLAKESWKNYQFHSPEEIQNILPNLQQENLLGVATYQDVIVQDKNLVLYWLDHAITEYRKRKAHFDVLTNTEVKSVQKNAYGDHEITVFNEHEGDKVIKSRVLIFSLGPFTDQFFQSEILSPADYPWNSRILPSKGSHLWLNNQKLQIHHPVVIQDGKGRVIFAIPHPTHSEKSQNAEKDNRLLLGTTEEVLPRETRFEELQVTEYEESYLISNLKAYFPGIQDEQIEVLGKFCGVRPLALTKSASAKPGKVSRHHQTVPINETCYAIIGGKYTTFRTMGDDVLKKIGQILR